MSCEAVSARRNQTLNPRSISLLSYIAQRWAMAATSPILAGSKQRIAGDQDAPVSVEMENAFRHLGCAKVEHAAARKRHRLPGPELAVGS